MRIAIAIAGLCTGLIFLGGCQTGDKAPRPSAAPAPTHEVRAEPSATRTSAAPEVPTDPPDAATAVPTTSGPETVSDPEPGASAEPVVYLAPIEDFPAEITRRLRDFFREQHGIEVGVLPAVPIREEAVDYARHQLIADRLLDSIVDTGGVGHAGRAVIGLTDYDIMMLDKPEWIFVFSLRDTDMNAAVISVARMDPRSFGERPDEDLLFMRAAKMVAKSIGVLYLGLPMSSDPRSVMYDRLYSLDALDRVSNGFILSP